MYRIAYFIIALGGFYSVMYMADRGFERQDIICQEGC